MVAGFNNADDTKCSIYSGNALNSNAFDLIDKNDIYGGLILTLNSGDQCKADTTKNYSVVWKLICDSTVDGITLETPDFKTDQCINEITARTKESCPKVDLNAIWNFLNKYSSFIGAFIILLGIFLAFFGLKILKATMFIVAFLATLFLLFILLFQLILPTGAKDFVIWIIIGCSVILGILLGIFTVYYRKVFFGLLGGLLGYVVGTLLYTIVLKYISSNPQAVFWVTIVVCIIIFAVLAYFLVKLIVIVATSTLGSYGIIRGISLYAGYFPSESLIIQTINNGDKAEIEKLFTWQVYVYFISFLILTLLTIYLQFRYNRDVDLDSEEKKKVDEEIEGEEYRIQRRLI